MTTGNYKALSSDFELAVSLYCQGITEYVIVWCKRNDAFVLPWVKVHDRLNRQDQWSRSSFPLAMAYCMIGAKTP